MIFDRIRELLTAADERGVGCEEVDEVLSMLEWVDRAETVRAIASGFVAAQLQRPVDTTITLDDITGTAVIYLLNVKPVPNEDLDYGLDEFRVTDRMRFVPQFTAYDVIFTIGDGDDSYAVKVKADGSADVWVRVLW